RVARPASARQNRLVDAPQVSLLRWLRRQLREPSAIRERLEAAVANDDPAEARRLVARLPFSDEQRRNVEQLLDAWDRRHAGR
ncbi:MAG TPA: hypothetical protein VH416_03725, partial [Gaiellaceae bacterium]